MKLFRLLSPRSVTIILLLLPSFPPPIDAIVDKDTNTQQAFRSRTTEYDNPTASATMDATTLPSSTFVKTKYGLVIKPEDHIIFRRLGQTAAIKAFGRIIIQVDLATPIALAYNLCAACRHEIARNTSSSFVSPLRATINTIEMELDQMTNALEALDVTETIMNRVSELQHNAPTWQSISSSPHRRTKRFFAAIAMAIGAAVVWTATNTAMSAANMANLNALSKVVADNTVRSVANQDILEQLLVTTKDTQHNIKTINDEVLRLNNQRIKDREEFLAFTTISSAAREVQTLATRFVRVCNELLKGHIDTSLVDKDTLENRLEAMGKKQIAGQQYQPVVTRVAEFVQLPVFSGASAGSLLLFVDVPLTLSKARMDVYKIHQVPVNTSAGFAELDSDLQYMAVSTGDRALFSALTQREFDACTSIGQEIICPKALTTWKRAPGLKHPDSQQCMFAAYRDDREAMQDFCTFRMANRATDVRRISPKEVLIFLTTETSIRLTCPSETVHHRFSGSILVYMQEACSLETDYFHHAADPDVVLEDAIPAPTIRIPNVLADLTHMHSDLVKEAAASSMTISHALIESKKIVTRPWQHHPNSTPGVLAFLGCLVSISALGILLAQAFSKWRKMRRRERINRARLAVMNDNERLLEEQRSADSVLMSRLATGGAALPTAPPLNQHVAITNPITGAASSLPGTTIRNNKIV